MLLILILLFLLLLLLFKEDISETDEINEETDLESSGSYSFISSDYFLIF